MMFDIVSISESVSTFNEMKYEIKLRFVSISLNSFMLLLSFVSSRSVKKDEEDIRFL